MTGTSPSRVIICGAGPSGTVLGMFLARKGYKPVIYEKVPVLADVGASLCLQSNGIKVLSQLDLLPALLDPTMSSTIDDFSFSSRSSVESPTTTLLECPLPKEIGEAAGGFPFAAVQRSRFQQFLVDESEKRGIKVLWGKGVVDVEQGEEEVTVKFSDGSSDTASFVVGCDGLHSAVQRSLFGPESATYTGLTQTAGLAPTPTSFRNLKALRNVFGPAAHFIAYPISDTLTSFAFTVPEDVEARESWGAMKADDMARWKENNPFAKWGEGMADCIRGTDRVVKFGLYDRKELSTWHVGRVVLIGDAAHPTSPHLGQGANQALEDCYHLSTLFPSAPSTSLSTPTLDALFTAFETPRIERTSALVKAARAMGEDRTTTDSEKMKVRDEKFERLYDDPAQAVEAYKGVWSHPF